MEEVDIKEYLNNIREKNKDNSVKYDKLIANIPYITNKKDLKKLKEILDELKNENKDFYDYIIHFLKTTNDLEEIFLLYKEYKDSKNREEILEQEIHNKDLELTKLKKTVEETNYDISVFDKEVNNLKSNGEILDDLEKTVSINMDSLFNKIEKEESQKLSFGMKALLALSSFLAFKNNKNILGTLLTSYLSYKVIEELISSKKNKYLDLCNDYINILEKYMDDTLNIEKELLKNLDNIDELESELKTKYKEYLDEAEFKNIFKMISNIKSIVNRSLDDIDKTKNHIDKNIDNGKIKIKELEA